MRTFLQSTLADKTQTQVFS